jgi:hypothetical protein
MFWTPEKHYLNDPFEAESELEAAIAAFQFWPQNPLAASWPGVIVQ